MTTELRYRVGNLGLAPLPAGSQWVEKVYLIDDADLELLVGEGTFNEIGAHVITVALPARGDQPSGQVLTDEPFSMADRHRPGWRTQRGQYGQQRGRRGFDLETSGSRGGRF